MAKAYGIHDITLKPGVKAEDFEKFVIEDVNSLPVMEGWEWLVLKGDRGDREGKYIVVAEIESLERLHRDFPSPGAESEESQQFYETHKIVYAEASKKWDAFVTTSFGAGDTATDYVVVGK